MSQFVEVSRKVKVGDRIKIVSTWMAAGYKVGDVLTVKEVCPPGVIAYVDGGTIYVSPREYVIVESSAQSFFSSQLFEKFTQFLRDNADEVRKIIEEESQAKPAKVADNNVLTREKVIAQAKADVAELERVGRDIDARLPEDSPFHLSFYRVDFHVNREKRAVTALVHRVRYNGERLVCNRGRNTAKCAPGEVFNADIGKAIALRRALGLTVPNEYLNAPQPDEPRVGAKVLYRSRINGDESVHTLNVRLASKDGTHYGNYAFTTLETAGWISDNQYEVIDDTDVDYSANETEVAA
ncbi:hypothetical protein M3231_15280 [Neobacillus mesonae]|nr:hypothetical protein [Neobacillus mesonae]